MLKYQLKENMLLLKWPKIFKKLYGALAKIRLEEIKFREIILHGRRELWLKK